MLWVAARLRVPSCHSTVGASIIRLLDKQMEHEMETWFLQGLIGILRYVMVADSLYSCVIGYDIGYLK